MKKGLMFLAIILLVTGCKNQLKCTQTTEDETYKLNQNITFNFDKNDKVTSADTVYTMVFETEEDAKDYYTIFSTLSEDYNIEQKKNKITVKDSQDYSNYDQGKKELKKELEKNGYKCK